MDALHALAHRFGGQVEFFVVYIKEAHPEDGWVLTANWDEAITIDDPRTPAEREQVASSCAVALQISLPVLLDNVNNEVARRYGGWPDRLYLVGRDGRIAFQGGEGPYGFKPEELEAAIDRELASSRLA